MSLFDPNEKKDIVGPTMQATPSLGTNIGAGARRAVDTAAAAGKAYANFATGNLETAINIATTKPRLLGGLAVDAARGFTGAPTRHDAGSALPGVTLPRPFTAAAQPAAPAPAAAVSAPSADVRSTTTVQAPRAPTSAPARGAVDTAPASPTLVPGLRTLDGRAGSLASSRGEFGENVYDNASIDRLAGRNAQPGSGGVSAQSFGGGAPVATSAIAAPQAQAATLSLPRQLSGDLAGAEQERQKRLSDIDSAMFGLRGRLNSRGRRDLFSTLLGQQNQLTRDRVDQVTGLETEGARLANAGATEQARLQQQANQGNADRTLQTDQLNTEATLAREKMADDRHSVARTLLGADGTTSLLRSGGSVTPLTDANGQPFREDRLEGSITDAKLFDAYRADIAGINQNALPQERAELLAEVDARPEYALLLGSLRKPTLQRFLESARPFNPNASDSDLAEFYRRRYGGGGLHEEQKARRLEPASPRRQKATCDWVAS